MDKDISTKADIVIKPVFKANKSDLIFAVLTFFLAWFFIEFCFFFKSPKLGFLVFTVLFIAISLGYTLAKGIKPTLGTLGFYLLALLSALPLALYNLHEFAYLNMWCTH